VTDRTAAVIGAGSQGRVHATAWSAIEDLRVVAVADIATGAADQLASEFGAAAYGDHRELLAIERPEFVSVCTPPGVRLDVVRDAIAAGVRAIHVEKPIALSYGDALEMGRLADAAGVQLTVNLQRRFEAVQRHAAERIAEGAIGRIVTIEGYCPNLPDWGTHIIDLIFFHLRDLPASWVFGQVDVSVNRWVYGQVAETSSLTQIGWEDGVRAIIATGREPQTPVRNLANDTGIIVQGTEGRVLVRGADCRVQRFGAEEEVFPAPNDRDPETWDRGVDPSIVAATVDAVADLVAALDAGREPALAFRHGLAGAEIVFATYESSRSRRRVGLPLDRLDNALLDGLDQGFWSPVGELRSTW
jgi:predicted dehydrogenase